MLVAQVLAWRFRMWAASPSSRLVSEHLQTVSNTQAASVASTAASCVFARRLYTEYYHV